jgi:predicted ester cyclase
MTEENKAMTRRVYEIISTGDFGRAEEIVDQDAPDNELLSYDPPAKLIDTFKETFAEAREAFPDLSITVEDVMAEGDRVATRVTMRGTHRGEFHVDRSDRQAGGGESDRHVPHLRRQDRGALGAHRGPSLVTPSASRSALRLQRPLAPRCAGGTRLPERSGHRDLAV